MSETLLTVNDLKVYFPIRKGVFSRIAGYVYAVDGVSLTLKKGETRDCRRKRLRQDNDRYGHTSPYKADLR